MTDDTIEARRARAWTGYWQGQSTNHVLPPDHPGARALEAFWAPLLESRIVEHGARSLVDVACGHGEVALRAHRCAQAAGIGLAITCVDIAEPALERVRSQLPAARTVVGDARSPPIPPRETDLVVSQFGIEYAGLPALIAAGRLVAPGGTLALVVHRVGSALSEECAHNETTVQAVIDTQLLPALREMFVRAASRAGSAQVEAAARRVRAPARALEQVVRARGQPFAGGKLAARLLGDCGRLYARAARYDPREVLQWIDGMSAELVMYRDRMRTMQEAALSEEALAGIVESLTDDGLAVRRADALSAGSADLAWAVEAHRPVSAAPAM